MQYALIVLGKHRILVDACEVSVLNAWREHPIIERDDFDENAHDFHVCYGGYLLNPATPAADIHEKLAQQADHWISAVTTGESACRQIGLCALRTFPLVTAGCHYRSKTDPLCQFKRYHLLKNLKEKCP